MDMMKAARIFGPGDMRVVEMPIPALRSHDVLCRVLRCGICATDYAIYTGEFSFVKSGDIKFPMTPGHEWSGVATRVGAEVTRLKPGDRLVGDTAVACGACNKCLLGAYYDCDDIRSVGTVNTWDGAYAEYIVMPDRHLFPLPERVSFDNGAMVEPAATALSAVVKAQVGIGDTVLVHGTGPIGIMAGKLAKLAGAARVIITGRKKFKLQAAVALGIDAAVDTTEGEWAKAVRDHAGAYGVDRVIEASGSTELLRESLALVKQGGVVSAVAFYERPVERFDIDPFVFGNLALRGSAGSLGMYPAILKLMDLGALDFSSLITGRYQFDQVGRAMTDMKDQNETRIKLMLEMPG
jgi:2-desacetyl-2-hydroxyethyl bacteriochlorophyllide A dehydrogenase